MRYWEIISEEGKIVPGVNTTPDVQPGEIMRQGAKLGFNLDANGLPPIWTGLNSSTGAKDTPNKPTKGQTFYGRDGKPANKKAPMVESANGAPDQFFWKIPVHFIEMIKSWPEASKSPYSNSFYNLATGKKDWGHTPEGSLRISDHWNFKSEGEIHCPTDRPAKNNGSQWCLAQWRDGLYVILEELAGLR
jgi:hypothetical protein